MQSFTVNRCDELQNVYFYQQIANDKDNLLFTTPWCGAILRNSMEGGKILSFDRVLDYETYKNTYNKAMWLHLQLKLFRHEDTLYGVYCCPQCDIMKGTVQLSIDQDPVNIQPRLCIHSKICTTLLPEWNEIWNVNLDPNNCVGIPDFNCDTVCVTLQKQSKDKPFLGAIRSNHDIMLLYTATKNQKTPFCSGCTRRNCRHYTEYLKSCDTEQSPANEDQTHVAQPADIGASSTIFQTDGDNADTEDTSDAGQRDSGDNLQEGTYREEIPLENEKHRNYWEPLSRDEHERLYGYNFEKLKYPIKHDPEFQRKWLLRLQGNYDFPSELIPKYKEGEKCTKHQNNFDETNTSLILVSKNIKLYSELGEKVFDVPVFSRLTIGRQCKCTKKLDGTPYLIWNLGGGRFIEFGLLYSAIHKFAEDGTTMFALWKSIRNTTLSSGMSCTLTYNDIHRAVTGYVNNIDADWKTLFSCPVEGSSPSFFYF